MDIVAIAAVADNGVIGDGERLPWHLGEDFRRFKRETMGHAMIMGRRTYDSMGALPGRTSIVVTREPEHVQVPPELPEGTAVRVVGSLDAAIEAARSLGEERCFVVGGGQIYAAALEACTELDITHVHGEFAGRTHFPRIDPERWREAAREERGEFAWVTYLPR